MLVDKIEVGAYWELHPKEGILIDIFPDKREQDQSIIPLSLSHNQAKKLVKDLQLRIEYDEKMDKSLEKDSKTW